MFLVYCEVNIDIGNKFIFEFMLRCEIFLERKFFFFGMCGECIESVM